MHSEMNSEDDFPMFELRSEKDEEGRTGRSH